MNSEHKHDLESEGGIISHSSGAVRARTGGASVIQVETFGKHGIVMLWVTAFVASIAIVLACMAWYHASLSERETRVFNDNVLRMEARLEASGLLSPDQEH